MDVVVELVVVWVNVDDDVTAGGKETDEVLRRSDVLADAGDVDDVTPWSFVEEVTPGLDPNDWAFGKKERLPLVELVRRADDDDGKDADVGNEPDVVIVDCIFFFVL